MPQNKTSLEQEVSAWLETQGYPLEMRVAKSFQATGARVIQSEYYTDPTTQESREVDVVVSWQDDIDDVFVRIALVIECKSSKNKPWVLFSSKDAKLADPARVAQRAASRLGRIGLSMLAHERAVQSLPLFQLPDTPGYSMTQAFTSGNDICYAAASAVANAALAMASEPDHQMTLLGRRDFFEVIFPVLVTEARLFAATLEEGSSVSVREQSSGILLWRNPLVGMPHTIIHVVTLPALQDFVDVAVKTADRLLTMCRGELRAKIAEALVARKAKTPYRRT